MKRLLLTQRYQPKDLFATVKETTSIVCGILSVDETLVQKLYSDPKNPELVMGLTQDVIETHIIA